MAKGYAMLIAMLVLTVISPVIVPAADESPTTQPAAEDDKEAKLTLPWKRLDSLTRDQRKLIQKIHLKALDDIRAIKQRERDEILGVLTDEQELEIQKFIELKNAKRRAKDANQDEKDADDADAEEQSAGAATQPSDN